jgi:hypothetical protein
MSWLLANAEFAMAWTDLCPPTGTHHRWDEQAVQNVIYGQLTPEDAVEQWYNTKYDYTIGSVAVTPWTAMMWRDGRKLGCAARTSVPSCLDLGRIAICQYSDAEPHIGGETAWLDNVPQFMAPTQAEVMCCQFIYGAITLTTTTVTTTSVYTDTATTTTDTLGPVTTTTDTSTTTTTFHTSTDSTMTVSTAISTSAGSSVVVVKEELPALVLIAVETVIVESVEVWNVVVVVEVSVVVVTGPSVSVVVVAVSV